jgi:hypothetical protein
MLRESIGQASIPMEQRNQNEEDEAGSSVGSLRHSRTDFSVRSGPAAPTQPRH